MSLNNKLPHFTSFRTLARAPGRPREPEYIPLPDLASTLHGSPVDEVIQVLQELSELAINIHLVATTKSDHVRSCIQEELDDAYQAWGTKRYTVGEKGRPHLTTIMDVDSYKAIIRKNRGKIGDPARIVLRRPPPYGYEISRGQQWFLRCAIHPDADPDGSLARTWSAYLEPQPQYLPCKTTQQHCDMLIRAYDSVMQYDKTHGPGTHPGSKFHGLGRALRPFVAPGAFDAEAVYWVLHEFVRLGLFVAELWTHCWRLILRSERGVPLWNADGKARQLDAMYTLRMGDWTDPTPVRVRRVLAEENIGATLLFLANHVFPTAIAPRGSTISAEQLAWRMHGWILDAVRTKGFDAEGRIARVIRDNALDALPLGGSTAFYHPPGVLAFFSHDRVHLSNINDGKLEVGSRGRDVLEYANAVRDPPDDRPCSICYDDMTAGEEPCVWLLRCGHVFHAECVQPWIIKVHVGRKGEMVDPRCPNCREVIFTRQTMLAVARWEASQKKEKKEGKREAGQKKSDDATGKKK
ncbi:hypothetical protein BU26DRAFT_504451 [Trematosphaeria pertusa]|uniref:RING-type domain-containing protein n=1 Tax=Trematosphaeria pertusa TaxID=390896 RepID=A0A6A6II17_9PLEO|nr:uncharacterized protein BU26DRAFT_504451 [Trematosphaeria pertusa]KAF2250051.1 hypothetical protein BU26DRAFT_504451 [Trematosphaeria pertusa]